MVERWESCCSYRDLNIWYFASWYFFTLGSDDGFTTCKKKRVTTSSKDRRSKLRIYICLVSSIEHIWRNIGKYLPCCVKRFHCITNTRKLLASNSTKNSSAQKHRLILSRKYYLASCTSAQYDAKGDALEEGRSSFEKRRGGKKQ